MSITSNPGRAVVKILGPCPSQVYNWDYEVLDHDGEGCERISDGVGFNFFLDYLEFPGPGTYLITGIVQTYYPAYSTWDEADEEFEVETIQPVPDDFSLSDLDD